MDRPGRWLQVDQREGDERLMMSAGAVVGSYECNSYVRLPYWRGSEGVIFAGGSLDTAGICQKT